MLTQLSANFTMCNEKLLDERPERSSVREQHLVSDCV